MTSRFLPGVAGAPSAEVELTLSARGLKDMDVFSKSDPFVVVTQLNVLLNSWERVGATEVIYNNLNPDFASKIVVEYKFEQQQVLKFDVYDVDTPDIENLDGHDHIGSCTVNLGEIVSQGKIHRYLESKSGYKPTDADKKSSLGCLFIAVEEMPVNRDDITLQFSASGLKRRWWSVLSPYLEAHKVDESTDHTLVYRSEVVQWNSSPLWQPFTLQIRCLCGGDLARSVRLRCLSDRGRFDPKVIGETFVTLSQLLTEPSEQLFLLHPVKQNLTGHLHLKQIFVQKKYSFLEFVMGGMQIHCTIAIDFTASNGDPRHPESLHYFSNGALNQYEQAPSFHVIETIHGTSNGDPRHPESLHYFSNGALNQYEQAILAVVPVLEDYSSAKIFPVYGFGGKFPPHGLVSHEFLVDGACEGASGVLAAYKNCISQIQLFGPTNFSPIINRMGKTAEMNQDGSQYFILLIITDGVITDMLKTKQAIIAASTTPLSIVIVGVGPADFAAMSELDGDENPINVLGVTPARDIVQFVPFREFQRLQHLISARHYLAQEVLAEIPAQVVSYMQSKNFAPGAGKTASSNPPTYMEAMRNY